MRAIGVRLLLGVIVTACSFNESLALDTTVEWPTDSPAHKIDAHASQPSSRPPASVWAVQHQLISKIRGMSVENRDGQYLGKISDFIVDGDSGKVVFGIISYGGLFGFGSKLKAVPAGLLSLATAKVGVASLDTGRRRWDRAPVFKRTDLAGFRKDPEAARALYRYYAINPENSRTGTQQRVHTYRSSVIGQESSASSEPMLQGRLDFASSIIGDTVVDNGNLPAGKITDLLIDLDGRRPTMAILAPRNGSEQSAGFAVALFSLKPEKAETLRIDANPRNFALAPALNDEAWRPQRRHEAVIYRFQ